MFREKDQVQNSPKYQDKESLAQALITAGISSDAARHLADLGRISLQLLPIDQQTKTKQPFSKIGGLPDLPEGMKWPIRPSLPPADYPSGIVAKLLNRLLYRKPSEEELNYRQNPQPYSFIAQISFEEMALLDDQSLLLPDGGALYLFYDVLIQGWGFDPKDAVGFKVIYVPDTDNLKKATKPNFYKEVPDYKEVLLEPSLRFERSRSEGLHFEKLPISEADKKAYIDFDERIEIEMDIGWPEMPAHKVRGWSNNVQGPMEEECALVTSGINCGGPEGYTSPEAKRIIDAPNEWIQLLQIDSDDGTGMMWGDAGMLYLWIKKSDLKKREFENTWLILQCS